MFVAHYISDGPLLLPPGCDTDAAIDFILKTKYPEEVCLSTDWSLQFISNLMYAGFLVMSFRLKDGYIILAPKHHTVRNVIFFDELHIGKTMKRLLPRYTLKADDDFNLILDKCVEVHGDGWLTPPLAVSIKLLKENPQNNIKPFAFGVYKNGALEAGEFGVIAGNVYTSYSGYFEAASAGRAQMLLTSKWLQNNGFAFWDLGMPLPYKYTLGARDLSFNEFISLFRQNRAA
jgi:Leu/Phe-tRNA-protein transferase